VGVSIHVTAWRALLLNHYDSLLCFAAAFGNLIFGTENQWTRGTVGFAGLLVVCLVALVMRMGKHQKDEGSMV
jgi:hypothetical protein